MDKVIFVLRVNILCWYITESRVQELPEEIGFFPEEWKKLERRWYFFQFLPEESGNKLEESGRNWKKHM